MPNHLRSFATIGAVALAFSIAPAQAQEAYEYGTSYSAASVLPAALLKGAHYQIRDEVISDGFLLTYAVDSDYGPFRVTGDFALQKLLTEIAVIAELKAIAQSEAFAGSVAKAATSPLRLGESLITDPVDTVTGVPRGLFQIFQNAGESVTSASNPSEDDRMKQALFVSSWKRDYCAKLGCDVYSSNSILQQELNRIGWASAIGGLSVSAATTVATGGAVMAFSAARTADDLNEALRAEPPARLRLINEEKLAAMGVQADLAQRFLDNGAFTPRHQTLIVAALDSLDGVAGRDRFIELCLNAQDEVGANFYQNVADVLAGYHTSAAQLKEIVPLMGVAAASAMNGRIVIAVAWDHAVYEKAVATRMDQAIKEFAARGLPAKFDVWATGTVSPRLKEEGARRSFVVTENIETRIPIHQ